MKYERDVFFNEVRDTLFDGALSQEQVDGMSVILAVWEYQGGGTPMDDERWLAYMMATVHHETATKFWPIEEYGKGQGHEYGRVDPETSQTYYGRGFVQLTWRENYAKASKILSLYDDRDLEWHPYMALDSLIATRVLFRGMAEGWFTGRKLGQYFNDTEDDPLNARQIINGNDDDELIAGYHDEFLDALRLARIPEPSGGTEVIDVAINRSSKNVLVSITLDDRVILAAGT
jgi:putative chitinase